MSKITQQRRRVRILGDRINGERRGNSQFPWLALYMPAGNLPTPQVGVQSRTTSLRQQIIQMSQKKVLGHREKSISSSELVLNLKTLVDKLWQQMIQLQYKKQETDQLKFQSHEQYKRWKNTEGNEQYAGYHWRAFKAQSDISGFLQIQIQAKSQAWKKFSCLYDKQQYKHYEKLLGKR